MWSLVDGATTVFDSCFSFYNYRQSCTVWTLLAHFLLPKMAERRFLPLGGRARPEVTSPIDSLTPIWYKVGFGILRLSLIDQKLFDFFIFACKMPSEISGEGVLPTEKNFSSMKPPKSTSLWRTTSFEA
jgi:hypothetical protein